MLETIKDFLYVHPWWHAALVLVPPVVIPAWVTIHYKRREAIARAELTRLREEANVLRKKLGDEVTRIADLQKDQNQLHSRLNDVEEEKSGLLALIAVNTKQ